MKSIVSFDPSPSQNECIGWILKARHKILFFSNGSSSPSLNTTAFPESISLTAKFNDVDVSWPVDQ
ncbi:hypothetical protein GBA52_029076 [Prunus armeniaca]|nr:hypothetical protein GBA52_029076 [Prunus armeniaca]